MAEETTTTTKITVSSKQPQDQQQPNNPFVFLSLIPKLLLKPLQFLNNKQETKVVETDKTVIRVEEEKGSKKAPDVVRFTLTKPDVAPVKLESEDAEKDTHPIVLWQIYALGGFVVLKWAWGKWQERKAKAKEGSPEEEEEEEDSPADD